MTAGPLLFARYAFPPNSLGYCGTDESRTLLEYGEAETADGGLVQLARTFEGAWPYLELIAGANGLEDPLDEQVVEAYWVGNELLERVDSHRLVEQLDDRFRGRAGSRWSRLRDALPETTVPHHNFHVFGVYPFVGLLRAGNVEEPLHVLDSCRIAPATVESVDGETAVVGVSPLAWDGEQLHLAEPVAREVRWRHEGLGFLHELRPGDTVSVHWDWVCDRLSAAQAAALRRYTRRMLGLANGGVLPAAMRG